MTDTPLTAEKFLLDHYGQDAVYFHALLDLLTEFDGLKVAEKETSEKVLRGVLETQKDIILERDIEIGRLSQQLGAVQTELEAMKCRRDW